MDRGMIQNFHTASTTTTQPININYKGTTIYKGFWLIYL